MVGTGFQVGQDQLDAYHLAVQRAEDTKGNVGEYHRKLKMAQVRTIPREAGSAHARHHDAKTRYEIAQQKYDSAVAEYDSHMKEVVQRRSVVGVRRAADA